MIKIHLKAALMCPILNIEFNCHIWFNICSELQAKGVGALVVTDVIKCENITDLSQEIPV